MTDYWNLFKWEIEDRWEIKGKWGKLQSGGGLQEREKSYFFVVFLYGHSRNCTKTEIIAIEIGLFSGLLWTDPMESPHVLRMSPWPYQGDGYVLSYTSHPVRCVSDSDFASY